MNWHCCLRRRPGEGIYKMYSKFNVFYIWSNCSLTNGLMMAPYGAETCSQPWVQRNIIYCCVWRILLCYCCFNTQRDGPYQDYCAASWKVAGSIPDGIIRIFFIDINLLASLWPWVESACSRSEYQEYFLRSRVGGYRRLMRWVDNLTTFMSRMWELQPPGTLRACPGCIGFALPLTIKYIVM
jgi:hypothetical protein